MRAFCSHAFTKRIFLKNVFFRPEIIVGVFVGVEGVRVVHKVGAFHMIRVVTRLKHPVVGIGVVLGLVVPVQGALHSAKQLGWFKN